MELMDASQFVTYFNEAGNAAIVDNGINTNWIDETFQNALLNVMILAFLGLQKEQIIICLELFKSRRHNWWC
jgi:hypothetical protein